jgi:hypothetical protein
LSSDFNRKESVTSDFDNFEEFPNELDFQEYNESDMKNDAKSVVSESEKNNLPKIQSRLDNLRIPATPGRPIASRIPLKAYLPPAHGLQITPLSTVAPFLANFPTLVPVKQLTPFEARLIAARSMTDETQRAEIEMRILLPPMIASTPNKLKEPGQHSSAHFTAPLLLIVKTLHHNKMTERAIVGICYFYKSIYGSSYCK